MGGNPGAMTAGIQAEKGQEKAFGKWLEDYLSDKPQLLMDSRMELEQQCSQFAGKYTLILGLLCGVLFVIGILNFFNTSAVSVLSRKKELSLLEAVGMTRKQILRMLCSEGGIYFLTALLLADTAGIPLMGEVIARTAGRSFLFCLSPIHNGQPSGCSSSGPHSLGSSQISLPENVPGDRCGADQGRVGSLVFPCLA